MKLDPMTQRGTREELVAMLREQSEGWYWLAKDTLSEASTIGADTLESGASEVQVGHTVYSVTDG